MLYYFIKECARQISTMTIPEDLYAYIYKMFFSTFVLPRISTASQDTWMWRCTPKKKRLCTERGAIQLGYTNNDSWCLIYVRNFFVCTVCTYNSKCCSACKKSYHDYIKFS